MSTPIHQKTYMSMCIEALFVVAQIWKQRNRLNRTYIYIDIDTIYIYIYITYIYITYIYIYKEI